MLLRKWYCWVIGLSVLATIIAVPVALYFTLAVDEDTDVCSSIETAACVEGKGVCAKNGSTWNCICNAGYMDPYGKNKECVDINECYVGDTSSCQRGKGKCINMESTWMCRCEYGYHNPAEDTKSCVVLDRCSHEVTSSCEAGKGTCVNLGSDWMCECNEGYRNLPSDTRICEVDPCGINRDITTDEGELTYPAGDRIYYSSNIMCVWTLSTDPANIFILIFTRFTTYHAEDCNNLFLRIQDGLSQELNDLERFCGDTKPGANGVLSTNHSNIRLMLNVNIGAAVFTMTWKAVPVENPCVTENTTACGEGNCIPTESTWMCYCNPGYENLAEDNKTCVLSMTPLQQSQCGSESNFTAETGELEFPDHYHALYYPNNIDCEWFISTTPGLILRLSFEMFEIQQSSNCKEDYIELQDDFSPGSPRAEKFCGFIPPDNFEANGKYDTKDNYVRVRFHSDDIIQEKGFKLTWVSVSSCGAKTDISTEEGILEFPVGVKVTYSNNVDCAWNLTTTPGKVLILNFLRFQIELSTSCAYDYLELQDGPAKTKKFCGDNKPGDNGVYTTASNSILLVFQSDDSFEDEGFKLTWTSDWKD